MYINIGIIQVVGGIVEIYRLQEEGKQRGGIKERYMGGITKAVIM
jgi:hypothetical protein